MDPLGQSQILPYIFGLSKNIEYKFTIISFEKINNFKKHKKLIKSKLFKNKINWIPLNYTKKPPILSTLWDIYKLRKVVSRFRKKNDLDLIHCRSYISSLVALNFKKKYNIPFIFDMRGFYADERIDGKIWKKNHFIFNYIFKYFKKKEKDFMQYSDYVISLTYKGKEEIISWELSNQSPISVIPCCTDKKLFQKKNAINIKEKLGFKKDDFILSYVGSIGTWYMLEEMLCFFKELENKKQNSKFLFITKDDPNLIYIKSDKLSIERKNIIIQPSSREMMPSYIGISNFSIFFIQPVFSKKASSPTKMGEIMNLGIPIICNSGVGDVDEILDECMPELKIKNFNKIEYQRVISLIIKSFTPNRTKIIQTSNKYYSLEKGILKYLKTYQKVLNIK